MIDDRTAKAKLRDAAIEIVAESGSKGLTARGVAERAGLSAGLIRHHFGSMSDLLLGCDQFIVASIKKLKEGAIESAPHFDVLSTIRASDSGHIMGYLAMRLADDSDHINTLVDSIVTDAAGYLAEGVDRDIFVPTSNEQHRAAMVTVFALGSLVMHRHLSRLMGVDVRASNLLSQPGFTDYMLMQLEVFTGVVTPALSAEYIATLDTLQEES